MGKALLVIKPSQGTTGAGGNNRYAMGSSIGGGNTRADAAATYVTSYFGKAGAIVDFTAKFSAVGITRVITARQNTTGTTQVVLDTITIADGASGTQSGVAEPLSISAGTLLLLNYSVGAGSPAGAPWTRWVWQATANHGTIYAATNSLGPGAHDTTLYQPPGGDGTNSVGGATEANANALCRSPGTISKLNANIGNTNGNDYAVTISTRLNGAAGAQSVAFAAGATGKVQDSTHSDTLASGDSWCFQIVGGAGTTGSASVLAANVTFENTADNRNDMVCADVAGDNYSSTNTGGMYLPIVGSFGANITTEDDIVKVQHGFPVLVSNVRMFIQANAWTATGQLTTRLNGADATGGFAIPAGATGWIENTSDVQFYGANDDANLKLVPAGTTGKSINVRKIMVTEREWTQTAAGPLIRGGPLRKGALVSGGRLAA